MQAVVGVVLEQEELELLKALAGAVPEILEALQIKSKKDGRAWLKSGEFCEFHKINLTTLYRWKKDGKVVIHPDSADKKKKLYRMVPVK